MEMNLKKLENAPSWQAYSCRLLSGSKARRGVKFGPQLSPFAPLAVRRGVKAKNMKSETRNQ
jgi:hypothetical protein